jgi:pimeloyl-ACP methyl ester carboxylesterase
MDTRMTSLRTSPCPPPHPVGSELYSAPRSSAGAKPGDLIRYGEIESPAGSKGYVIVYWSRTIAGEPVAVSGVLYQPTPSPAGQPLPIVAWAHGTYGLGDHCTTRAYFSSSCRTDLVSLAVQAGAVFVATDYQGLGVPGAHPYLVGQSAACNVLDSIRAAAQLTGTGPSPRSLVLGWSQGGGAALFAAELQPTYAPELQVKGAVAVAPAAELNILPAVLDGGPRFGYLLMAAYGFRAAYPQLLIYDRLLTGVGRAALKRIGTQCVEQILGDFANRRGAEFGVDALLDVPDFRRRLEQNSPGSTWTSVPILLIHGEDDDTIPAEVSRILALKYTGLGVPISMKLFPGFGHPDVFDAASGDILCYAADCLMGRR